MLLLDCAAKRADVLAPVTQWQNGLHAWANPLLKSVAAAIVRIYDAGSLAFSATTTIGSPRVSIYICAACSCVILYTFFDGLQ